MSEVHTTERALLEVRDLEVVFGRRGAARVRAVAGASFDVGRGETLGLVGESGSGKSTLARAVMRLVRADGGVVTLDGTRLDQLSGRSLRRQRTALQMVFQDPYSSLDPSMTVGESVAEPLEVHTQLSARERDRTVGDLLERVGLSSGFARRYPDELSGGQRQRVAIARAIALRPKLVVCDESLSALDVSTQNQIIRLLEDIQAESGTAYLFIAHDLAVVRHISHRVAVMYMGRIVDIGPVERVFDQPGHPYTEALLSAIPVPVPRVQRTRQRITLAGDPPDPASPPPGCPFHPRCRFAFDRCRIEVPRLQAVRGGGLAACHLHDSAVAVELRGAHADDARFAPGPALATGSDT